MPAAYFVVRATVSDPGKRAAFDKWYQTEHLPDAARSFGAKKAWRFWSLSDPAVHQATYQFDDEAALDRATKGEDIKRLTADFNRDWPDVTRTLAEEFGACLQVATTRRAAIWPSCVLPQGGDRGRDLRPEPV